MNRRSRIVIGVALCALFLGCKKPEVEVEEEGPPLPGAPGAEGPNAPGQPGPKTQHEDKPEGEAEEPPKPAMGLTDKEACRLLDAHMRYAGLDPTGRTCSNLRKQGDSVRLNRYYIPKNGSNADEFDAYNACFWPLEVGEGWEVGYIDNVVGQCLDRDLFCKAGAPGTLFELSFKGCPGDKEHLILDESALRPKLLGKWRGVVQEGEPARMLDLGADGSIRHQAAGTVFSGQFTLLSTSRMEANDGKSGIDLSFAVVGDSLHVRRGGVAAMATDKEAFYAVLGPKLAVRRFRKACYLIHTPAEAAPEPVECALTENEQETFIDITLSAERQITLIRVGDYWMDANTKLARFQRVPAPQKATKPQ